MENYPVTSWENNTSKQMNWFWNVFEKHSDWDLSENLKEFSGTSKFEL